MIECKDFLTASDGTKYKLFTIKNNSGAYVQITDIGAGVVSICVPDRYGKLRDVALSYCTAEGFERGGEYFGATVGRCCGRIDRGICPIEGKNYTLTVNNPPNHLHGGVNSFSRRVWQSSVIGDKLRMTLFSPDGEEGYPSDLYAEALFSFDDNNKLTIEYGATSSGDTICNMTNHTYFNLNGHGSGKITDHILRINADNYIPIDQNLIPTGIHSVQDTPFDFRKEKPIGADISINDEQLKIANGYDQCYVLNGSNAACAYSRESGILLECTTTAPAMQLYTANYVDVPAGKAKGGKSYGKRDAFCLEAQGFPDAVNHPSFPQVTLKKGQKYSSQINYFFSLQL